MAPEVAWTSGGIVDVMMSRRPGYTGAIRQCLVVYSLLKIVGCLCAQMYVHGAWGRLMVHRSFALRTNWD